ncbi:MAG: RimK family alpha-L-glutamate ligase [Desulfobacterales bacterium]|nr:RimK family alpha-L-glutamate ligase [Desulfobacterales bacterium]
MIIGILTVNGPEFHPNGRLMAAAKARGHGVVLMDPYGLMPTTGRGDFLDPLPHGVLPRQGSPMGEYGFVILRELERRGVPLINGVRGVTLARHQYLTLQALEGAGLPVPRSCFISRSREMEDAASHLGGWPLVLKHPTGMGGDGVVCMDDLPRSLAWLETQLVHKQGVVVQEYIPPVGRMDLRILVVGDRVVGAMALTPSDGEFRANVHQKGRAESIPLDPAWETMALQAAKACCLDIAGVDMMVSAQGRPMVSEVNYSPGFRGLEAATGLDIAGMIVDHAISCIEANT